MTTEAVAPVNIGPEERALLLGDISKLNDQQRADLVTAVCRSLGLNPLTRPFQYITLNSKLTLYATKDCTDQLRRINRVGTQIVGREMLPGEIYCVTARALLPDGRTEERIGAVSVAGLRGEALANALMKAETKAVRRVTLGACGLGFLDETEVETIPGAYQPQSARTTNRETGEIATAIPPRQVDAGTNGQAPAQPDPARLTVAAHWALAHAVEEAMLAIGETFPHIDDEWTDVADLESLLGGALAHLAARHMGDAETPPTDAQIERLGKAVRTFRAEGVEIGTPPKASAEGTDWLLAFLGGVAKQVSAGRKAAQQQEAAAATV